MAASKGYFARTNYRFLRGGDGDAPIASDSVLEFDESDVWSTTSSASPEFRKPAASSFASKKAASAKRLDRDPVGGAAASLPMNIPDWSKILKDEYRENRRREADEDFDREEDDVGLGEARRVPPHEFLARTRIASLSVHEGIGRTLKGRDLSRVRNAIWEKTGFQD